MFREDVLARKLPPTIPEGMTAEKWPAYRREMLDLFMREEYGYTPPAPPEVGPKRARTRPTPGRARRLRILSS